MKYSFVPEKKSSKLLLSYYRSRLHSSFIHMIEDLNRYNPELVNEKIISFFRDSVQLKYTGFQSLSYHNVIKSLQDSEEESPKYISHMMNILENKGYYERYTKNENVSTEILNAMLYDNDLPDDNNVISIVEGYHMKLAVSNMELGINILRECCEDVYDEISTIVSTITFFNDNKSSDHEVVSFTGDTMLTSVFINAGNKRSVIYLLDKIIHEAAHTYLFLINLQEKMVLNTRERIYISPLRSDKRDMIGIYHSTFVIQRLIYTFGSIINNCRDLPVLYYDDIISLVSLYYCKVDKAYTIVKKYGKLSHVAINLLDEGQEIVLDMKASLPV